MNRPEPSHSPSEWIRLLRNKDEEACQELLQLCCRVCRSHFGYQRWPEINDSDEVATDAFIKIFSIAITPNSEDKIKSSFIGWAVKITTHYCQDIKRNIERERNNMPVISLIEDIFRESEKPQRDIYNEIDDIAWTEVVQRLRHCLSTLNTRYQAMIIMKFIEQKSYDQIALAIDPPTTPQTVTVRVCEICRKLRICLEQGGFSVDNIRRIARV